LARAADTRRAFPDGILWLTLGQEPPLLQILTLAGRALGDGPEHYLDLPGARSRLPRLLADRRCLVVLDDVWDLGHAEPLVNALGPRSRLLLTTRDAGLVSALGAQACPLEVLGRDEARQLLADWVGQAASSLPPEADAVARECGRLPLALALSGAMVRDGIPWSDLLAALQEADLGFLRARLPNYPYLDVLKALQVSVAALEKEIPGAGDRYQELAVFPADTPVPEAAVLTLWSAAGLQERQGRRLLATLDRKSLLRLEGESPARRLSLHDLQYDFLRAAVADWPALHSRLLDAYRRLCPAGFPSGPDDGYFFARLPWHLHAAGRCADLRRLLLDYAWLRTKLAALGPAPLIADYDLLPADQDLQRIQGALRLSAHILAQEQGQLATQLLGRLLGFESPVLQDFCRQVLEEKNQEGRPWLRPLTSSLTPPGGPLLRTLRGHTDRVIAVALTPDGRRAVSGSMDNTLKVWDLKTGAALATLGGHTSRVSAVAVTPDGTRAVSGSWDRTLKVWDLETGAELATLNGHTGSVNAVALTPDGTRAVSGSDDETFKVWDLETGAELATLSGHTSSVSAVAASPDGRRAVSGSWDRTLKVWDLETGRELATLRGHTWSVYAVAVTPDGRRAVSGADDNTLKVWDLDNGREIATLSGHTDSVNAVAVTPDGRLAVSGSWDRTLKIWDLQSGFELATLRGHNGLVNAVAVTPDGQRAVSGSEDRTIKVWDLESGADLATLRGHTFPVSAVVVTPDGTRIVSGSDDDTLKVWNLETERELAILRSHTGEVKVVAVIPDGTRAVSGSNDRTLKVWDLENGAELAILRGHTSFVNVVAVTPDGTRAVSGSADNTLKVWDLESGSELATLSGHTNSVNAVAVSPDGWRAVSGSYDNTLKVWDLESGACLATVEAEALLIAIALAPDGRTVVAGDGVGQVHCLRLEGVSFGPILVTAWRGPDTLALGCPLCRRWSAIPESALGTELPCPQCGAPLKVNPVVIAADWRPVARAWEKGKG